jgi:type III secretory pathway component EscV
MKLKFRYSDLVLMMLVMAIAAMLIVPLPTFMLDLLLVCNLSFAILLLLVGLYVGSSAALFTFPSILLLSTLFRLGLNVASSRLILSQGEAGRVIEAFGTFLIRGEVVVGVIIFCIVTVVNFIVISNGAARVSEVAARFALDALPGKQMMIDNDARAGVISADEARQKRDELRRESQLYGSMDGAMKFVQGDAIAGILIILANIFGGMYMGLASGMNFNDAIQTYTVLTVGDGLVTQIPGLLTSICAGIIVTRVSSSERSSLSSDLHLQLFTQPLTLFVTAGILLVLAVMPGIPLVPFMAAALALGAAGAWSVRQSHAGSTIDAATRSERSELGVTSDTESPDHGIIVLLDKAQLYRLYRARVGEYSGEWRDFRDHFAEDSGISLPTLQMRADDLLAPCSYVVSHMGIEMFAGEVPQDAIYVEISSSQAQVFGLPVLKEEEHPATGHKLFWTSRTPAAIAMLKAARIRYHDFLGFIALRIGQAVLQHPEEYVSVTYVHSLLRQIEKKHPGLIADGFGREFVSIPKLTEILQELIRQGISIRDFRAIMESLASFCASNGITTESDSPVDIAEAVHYIRMARRRQIVRRFVGNTPALPVLSMSPEVEQSFEGASADRWSTSLAMAPELYDSLLQGLYAVVRPTLQAGSLPVALLCSREVKEKVISFVRISGLNIFVTTLDEIDPAFPVMQMGVWDARS